MNQVVVHPGVVARFMNDPTGPIARDLKRRSDLVAGAASRNASGTVLGVRSGDLLRFMDSHLETSIGEVFAVAGTTAIHNEFGYPRFHDRQETGGRPWLRSALREVFP